MKDGLGEEAISRLAEALARADRSFPAQRFLRDAMAGLESLELKQRVHHVIDAMHPPPAISRT